MTERKISAETAADYGLDQDEAHLALRYAAASKEATRHADADSILHILTPKQIVAVVDGSTVGGLYRRFHTLMRELVLPEKGFTSEHEAQTASQLLGTDTELRKHLAKLDIDWPKQERVLVGDAMRKAFRRAQEKRKAEAAGATPRRRGRPPRTDQATAQAIDTDAALATVKGDATLLRQWHKYQQLLTAVVLPPKGQLFKTLEEAANASNLANTYFRVRARQEKVGVDLVPENDKYIRQVASAASWSYQNLKPKPDAPTTPRPAGNPHISPPDLLALVPLWVG